VLVTCGRGSVLFCRRSDTSRTSGFVDDVISAQKPRLLDVAAQLRRSSHAALGLAINVTGNGRTGLLRAVGLCGSTRGGDCLVKDCVSDEDSKFACRPSVRPSVSTLIV